MKGYLAKNISMISLLVFSALHESGCSYYAEQKTDRVATIREVVNGKFRYEIELTNHIVAHGNPHLQTSNTTKYDDVVWVYTNVDEGVVDAGGNVAMVATRGSPESSAPLKGYLKFEAGKLTVSLSTMMYGDGRPTDRFVRVQAFSGQYELVRK